MKLKERNVSVNFTELFKIKTPYKFNCLCIGTAFRKDFNSLIVGGEDGIIRIYDHDSKIQTEKSLIQLETKGGPIQTLAVHDVTKFYNDDLVTGDSLGMVTVFCNQQILSRKSLSKSSIKCLQIHKDPLGNSCIVTSDESGFICAHLPSKDLWRISINNLPVTKGPSEKTVVTCLLCVDLITPSGELCSHILAADDSKHLHIIHQGEVVMTINTPDVVTAMCSGIFIESDKLETGPEYSMIAGANKEVTQVALGCANGAIHILHNFTVTEEEFANAKYHITELRKHPSTTSKTDHILCAGHFSALYVYHEGKRVGNYDTPGWISSMDILFSSKDKKHQVVLGCLDNSIMSLTLLETG